MSDILLGCIALIDLLATFVFLTCAVDGTKWGKVPFRKRPAAWLMFGAAAVSFASYVGILVS